jgi:hypothetical protein
LARIVCYWSSVFFCYLGYLPRLKNCIDMRTEITHVGSNVFFRITNIENNFSFEVREDKTNYAIPDSKTEEVTHFFNLDKDSATKLMIALQKLLF